MKKKLLLLFAVLGLCLASCGIPTIGGGNTANNTSNTQKPCVHNYQGKISKEPSCTEDGVQEFICSKCGDKYEETIKAKGHEMVLTEQSESVCAEESRRVYSCKNCDYTETETMPPAYESHDYEPHVIADATCTMAGTIEYQCSRCESNYTESLSRLEHNYEKVSDTMSKCADCGLECSYPKDLGFEGVVALYESMRESFIENLTEDELAKANPNIGTMWVEYSTYYEGKTDVEKGIVITVRAEYMSEENPGIIEYERLFPFQLSIYDGHWQFISPYLIELKQ